MSFLYGFNPLSKYIESGLIIFFGHYFVYQSGNESYRLIVQPRYINDLRSIHTNQIINTDTKQPG